MENKAKSYKSSRKYNKISSTRDEEEEEGGGRKMNGRKRKSIATMGRRI